MVRHTGEDFIDVRGVAITSVLSFQSPCINGSKLDAPEADRFSTDGDASFGEEVFDIPMAEVEAIIEPDGVGNNVRRESVALVCIHRRIISFRRVKLAVPDTGKIIVRFL